jgi:hypothetical protein
MVAFARAVRLRHSVNLHAAVHAWQAEHVTTGGVVVALQVMQLSPWGWRQLT